MFIQDDKCNSMWPHIITIQRRYPELVVRSRCPRDSLVYKYTGVLILVLAHVSVDGIIKISSNITFTTITHTFGALFILEYCIICNDSCLYFLDFFFSSSYRGQWKYKRTYVCARACVCLYIRVSCACVCSVWNIHHCNRNPLSNRQNTSNGILLLVRIIAVTVFVCQLLSLDLISITDIICECARCGRARWSARACLCIHYNIV